MDKLIAGAKKLGINLNSSQLAQFAVYYSELAEWNKRVNLTSITGIEGVYVKHFLDSLTVFLGLGEEPVNPRLIDIGAGAGFPGLPLKIALPRVELTLIEATARKSDFLEHIIDKLGLNSASVVSGRAEDIAHQQDFRERFDYAVSRGVAGMATLAELTLPFCAIGGRLIAQKKGGITAEVKAAATAIRLMGGDTPQIKRVELEALSDERYLVIVDKIEPTPEKYPRRPGMPAKRPIM